jgi:hypothetical protein
LALRQFWRHGRAWIAFALVWLLLYGAFFWWWEPWNIEFWIALLPLMALLVFGACYHTTGMILKRGIGIVTLLLSSAFLLVHLPPIRSAADPATDYYQHVTAALAPQLDPLDLVITRGNILDFYVPFYAGHPASNVISLRKLSFQGDAFWILHTRLREAHASGQTIYIDQIILDEPVSQERHPFGFSAEQISLLQQDFPIVAAIALNEQTVFYAINPRPAADTLRWSFERSLGGWRAVAAPQARYENGGWCFTGGEDIQLISPPLALDAADTRQISIEISSDRAGLFGQLYWQGVDQALAEERSLRFDLGSERQTYTLDLVDSAAWQGSIDGLRLDPAQDAADATICVYAITLATPQ